jgi:chlorobactene glucosyltransferase
VVEFFIYFILMGIILFELVLLLILLSNLWVLRRLDSYLILSPINWPKVSVLVPARNEEENIEACIRSLLEQQYPNFKVWVLDDHSTDRTWHILQQLATEDSRLTILKGDPLPADWLGKHWACQQLAQTARGELLLFTDADTRHHPLTLQNSVAALITEKADLLTAMPYEEVVTWGEKLVVPLIPWSIFSFAPLGLAYRLKHAALSATIGQFMLFRREAYLKVGGYKAVRHHAVDDLALGRRIKARGLRWCLVDGGQRIRCRMYHNFSQVYQGLSKNLFATFEYRIPQFLFVWLWLGFVFWGPLVILTLGLAGVQFPPYSLILAVIAVGMALFLWGITYWRFAFPQYLTLLYPITILLSVIIAFNSMVVTLTNRATWKERALVRSGLH